MNVKKFRPGRLRFFAFSKASLRGQMKRYWEKVDTVRNAREMISVNQIDHLALPHQWPLGTFPGCMDGSQQKAAHAPLGGQDDDRGFTFSSAELIQRLEKVTKEIREVFSTLRESHLNATRQVADRTVPVRWAILHVIDHTALHLGHMQITYQLRTGGKSFPSPTWSERLARNQSFE